MRKGLFIIALIMLSTSLWGWAQNKKFISVIETSVSGNHEAEDCLLLRQATDDYGIPHLSHLAEMRENKVLDTGNAYLLSTLQALSDYARQHFGEQSLEFIICQRYVAQYYLSIDFPKGIDLITKNKDAITSFCTKHPKNQSATILEMAIRLELLSALKRYDPDNPKHWCMLMDVEKAVEPFLKKKGMVSSDLSDVCFYIASLKLTETYYSDYIRYEADKKFSKGQLMEIETYLQKALEMNRQLWGEHSLYAIKSEMDDLNARIRFHTETYDTIYQRICEIQAYLTDYLPAGDMMLVEIELLKRDCNISYGQRLNEIRSPYPLLFKVSAFYGSDSEEYYNYLYRVAFQQVQVDLIQTNRLVKELQHLAKQLYEDRPDIYAQNLVGLFPLQQATAQLDAEGYYSYMELLAWLFENNHHASWASVFVGISFSDILAYQLQQTDKGVEVFQKTIQDIQQLTGQDNLLYASCLVHCQSYLRYSKDTATIEMGIAQCQEAIRIYKKYDKVNARAYQLLSEMKSYLGQHEAAMKTLREGIAAHTKNEEDSMPRCLMQMVLGQELYSYKENGVTEEVRHLFEEAIPFFMSHMPQPEDNYFNGYLLIGNYYRTINQYEKAEQVLQQGLEQYEGLLGYYSYVYLDILTNLYDLYMDELNDMDKAERVLEGKLEIIRQNPSFGMHQFVLELLWKRYSLIIKKNGSDWVLRWAALQEVVKELQAMATLSGGLNDQLKEMAMPLLYEAANLCVMASQWERQLESETVPDHEEAKTLYSKAKELVTTFRNVFSEQLLPIMLEEEQTIRQKGTKGIDLPGAYQLINSLANYYISVESDTLKAMSYYQLFLQSSLPTNRFLALAQLATIGVQQGHFAEAAELFDRLEELEKNLLATMTNTSTRISYNYNRFLAYYRSERYRQALEVARESYALRQKQINCNFDLLTETERLALLQSGGTGSDGIHLLLPLFPDELCEEGYDACLSEKGILLRASDRIRNAVLNSGNQLLMTQMDSLNRLNQVYKLMNVNGFDQQGQYVGTNEEVMTTRKKIEELERSINRQAAKYIGQVSTPDWKQLQAVLKPGEAAVEYVLSDSIVGVLVLLPKGRPHYVPLTATVNLWKELAEQGQQPQPQSIEQLYGEDCLRLYDRLWKPMEPLLSDVRCVYYSPSAFLNSLSFAAFKCADGQYLMDKYELHQMLSTGNLMEVRQWDSSRKVTSAMLLGAVFYSPDQQGGLGQEQNERGAIADEFCFLPFTQTEVSNVEQVLKLHHVKTSMMTGLQPTEQNLRQQNGQSADILHLSTHGFFLGTDKMMLENRFLTRFPSTRFSSMQRSGLALVGANQTWEGDTGKSEDADGILTANEVATLNLSHTRLAVLSACQTAVGRYDKEGVYGMHRGFKQAGVKSILASLWNVNDKSTARLMELFYEKWLSGTPMQQSLNEAVRELRKEYPSPFYWAPFVLMDAEN